MRKLKPIPSTDEQILTFSIGWATQRWLTGTFEPDKEIEVDGIIVTPDVVVDYKDWGSDVTDLSIRDIYGSIPWELKATYQSANKAIEENIHWMRQLMAECYVTGSTTAILSRFEIMSDWKFVFGKKEEKTTAKRPTLSAWRVEFTQEELDGFWQWMKERKVLYEEVLRTGVLLPKIVALASGQEWECSFCSYKEECDGNLSL